MDCDKYEKKKAASTTSVSGITNIGTQINGAVNTDGGNFNTGNAQSVDNSTTKNTKDEKWFQKEVVKMILSFIGGVGATLAAQWIMRIIGWIQ